MQGNREVIQALNKNLGLLLISINQYFLHGRILKNWGFVELSEPVYRQSIREMKSADDVIARILLLEGLPNLQEYGKVLVGETVAEMLACDLKSEQSKHEALITAIEVCEQQQDYVSRALLEKHKHENEEYWDWLQTQQDLLADIGLPNYLQSTAQED